MTIFEKTREFFAKRKLLLSVFTLVLTALMLGLTLAVYFNRSFGWFASNKNVTGSGMGASVQYYDVDTAFTCYIFDINNEIAESSSDLSDMDFNQYDLVFKNRNRYTPAIVRIAMNGSDLPSSGTVVATIARDTSKAITETQAGVTRMSKFSSSVMRFTPYVGTQYYNSVASTQYNNVNTELNYNTTRALTGNNAQTGSKVFTTVTMDGNRISNVSKDNAVELEFGYTSSDFVDGTLYAYIYITYDEGYNNGSNNGLVGIYQATSGLIATDDLAVTFVNDLTTITVAVAES